MSASEPLDGAITNKLSEHPIALKWLEQFRGLEDIRLARELLDSLKLISLSDFEGRIVDLLDTIGRAHRGRMALFTVDERMVSKGRRIPLSERLAGSHDRVNHILTGLERRPGSNYRANMSTESMRAERIKHIILVDDIIGTGKRICDFWKVWASPTIKSWLSLKYCRLWLVTYAAHESGIRRVLDDIRSLRPDSICHSIRVPDQSQRRSAALTRLCDQYGKITGRSGAARGVGQLMSPIVFQHGCPNNCPAILWSSSKRWEAMFPERTIPNSIYPIFQCGQDLLRFPNLLWDSGQYSLAISLLGSDLALDSKLRNTSLVTILGLLLKGVHQDNLSDQLLIEKSRIESILKDARSLGLISAEGKVGAFGRDIVERCRSRVREMPMKAPMESSEQTGYIPLQYRGVRRKSRNTSQDQ